jgi:N12 class adenine-specific DNA methylase
MASKFQFYAVVAEQAAKDVMHTTPDWMSFLDAAARMYKYSFPDQLMIYAQRPDAIACAPIELWNEQFGRFVRRGSKGIALIDDTGSYPRLKYVFDVNDTEPSRYNARPVRLWMMGEEHKAPILGALAKTYDGVTESFDDSFRSIARQLAAEYYEDNASEIRFSAEGSFLEDYDDFNLSVAFENALATSIAYTLMSRCGFDSAETFDDDDFGELYSFNTPNMVYALGTATSELSEQVLRDIELTIKKYERVRAAQAHTAERSATHDKHNQVRTDRGLSPAGDQAGRTAEGADRAVGTVRTDEESVPQRAPDNHLQFHAAVGEAVSPSAGNRGNSERTDGTGDAIADGGEPAARQTDRPDGLDGGDERLESTGGGNGAERTDLRIKETPEPPSGRRPSSEQAQHESGGGSSLETKPPTYSQLGNTSILQSLSTSSITPDEVDSILRDGGNGRNSVLRIAAFMAKNKTPEENAAFLRREYLVGRWGRSEEPGGKGFQFGTQPTSLWFDESGITVGRGKSALSARDFVILTWEQAAERVKALYDAGRFVSHDVLEEALHNESKECAEDLIEVYQNMARGIGDIQYELHKVMDKEQQKAVKDRGGHYRYLIRGLEELDSATEEALFGESKASPEEIMRLYDETISLSEEIPQEWGFDKGHPDTVERVVALISDKGKPSETERAEGMGYSELSEYAIILRRLREDVAALKAAPETPIHFYRNPYRTLEKLENAGLPPHGFPATEYQPLNFMRFITEDEVDHYLMHGGAYSEGKMRFLSYFLHEHTPKETEQFLKDEYGHGGGTWIDGHSNAEPGKGISLKRPGCDEVNLKYSKVAKRLGELVHSGRYMTRADLDHIPEYETIMLARTVNNFYYNLDDSYPRPFSKDLDFHYPKEAEWAAIHDFLGDTEQIENTLEVMQKIYVNTTEEDRYYHCRKAGFINLADYLEETYTLFPGLDKLPTPELAAHPKQHSATAFTGQTESGGQLNLFDLQTPELIAQTPLPVLPAVEEQQTIIEQKNEPAAEVNITAVSLSDDIDTILLDISDEDKTRLAAQFADNPRSREAVQLVREVYGGDSPFPLPQMIKRITEIAEDGRFNVTNKTKPTVLQECERIKAENGGAIVMWQVGDFFEMYGEDAKIAAVTLNVSMTQRLWSGEPEAGLMVGVPQHTLSDNLRKLNEAGYAVAVSSIGANEARNITLYAANTAIPEPAQEFDFDAIAQKLYERVIQDEDFLKNLSEAKTRAEFRNPVAWAVEQSVRDHEQDEPEIWNRYFSHDSDFRDNLLDYVHIRSWNNRETLLKNAVKQPEPAPELDFDTVAQTVFERVMQDAEYAEVLANAPSRGALRNPLNTALDKVINEHEPNETAIYERYYSDNDFNDRLFDFIYRQSWESKSKPKQTVTEERTAQDILYELADKMRSGALSYADVAQAAGELNMTLAEYGDQDPERHFGAEAYAYWNTTGNRRDDSTIRLDYNFNEDGTAGKAENIEIDFAAFGIEPPLPTLAEQEAASRADEATEQASLFIPVSPDSPPPVFFVDWKEARHDFDLRLYNDHDIIGYNKDGVEYELGRSGHVSYVTETGLLWGSNEVPGNIYEQINAYKSGDLTDEQVRKAYISILKAFVDFRAANLEETNGDLIDVLENGLLPQEEKDSVQILLGTELEYTNNDAAKVFSRAYKDKTETMTLQTGHTADYRTSENGLGIEILDKYDTTLFFSWADIALVIRALAVKWQTEFLTEHEPPVSAEQIIPQKPLPQPRTTGTNFRITDDHLGEGGAKTKFRYNMDAINTLHDIESAKRNATPEEQEVLSRYVGWGGLPQAFDPNNQQWRNEYSELKAALSAEEWESARASTPNAHYTSPTVIKAIYEAVERIGFESGNILEPSCGVGNFFGLLPDSMKKSKLYGVELDSISAQIAKRLYPRANIKQMGFEQTDTPDAFFDLAIGNVPFGDYGVSDKRYDKHHFSIHNYFFAKALDQVRPGGVIAFLTSKYMMDGQETAVRKYLAQRAELLGAVRLPNNTFLKNAGTETTTDIIFLQKRDRPIDMEPEWVQLDYIEDSQNPDYAIPVNQYFAENPEMILGKMSLDERMNNKYGRDSLTTCLPTEGADLAEQLKTALFHIQGKYAEPDLDDIDGVDDHSIPADPLVKNFSYALVALSDEPDEIDGETYAATIGAGDVYFRENSRMYPVELSLATLERIKGMCVLRDCVYRLIELQLDEYSDAEIKAQQAKLNNLYDRFTAEYGLINTTANNRAFNADSAYYLLCSLEILDEDGNLERKADMFTKRTIKQKTVITHVDTASEALAVSIGEKARVDLDYMGTLTGMNRETLLRELEGVIFLNVGNAEGQSKAYVTADEYLSGNVRKKLEEARAAQVAVGDGSLDVNVHALEAAQPKDLTASEINLRLGATWIEPEYIQEFMHHLFKTPNRMKESYRVNYHKFTGEWQVTNKGRALYNDVTANVTYGTQRMNAYEILHDTLNLKDVRVYDYKKDENGNEQRILNKNETTKAQQKQEDIKREFKDWIWQDPVRRQTLVKKYNELFNSTRPREYNGSHIVLYGATPEISFREHQANAVARQMYGGNTLLAHVVGAGKTFEMAAAAMEMKRIGLCHKSLFAVPNHLTEQWAGEFLRLYPSANILVATKRDFEMRNRRKFCAKIATGDYDAVIIGHSQLEKIPMSKERQERLLREQIWEIEDGINELEASNGERWSVKQLEKTKKSLEARLRKLLDATRRDDVVTFEQLGVDRLFIDESHYFKNLFLYTKMRNVAGLSTAEAQKSSDLFMKCRYMDELTGNKGVIFATGTPISNSMTEMYTVQRYLQYDRLMANDLTHFDCWASIFGETQTSIELAPEGTGYRARTRFSRFHNLPELMAMFKDVADIQTADMLNLPVPKVNYETIVVEPSALQKDMVQELSERAAAIHRREVDPSVDNMLKITTDGRKIGLDQRLINPLLPDFEGSKVNACTNKVFGIWEDSKAQRLTQLVFCDFSTPKKDGIFNVYDDIRNKLLARGVPDHEIAFIHDADTDVRKKELFAKVRSGKVRILLGSTFKMGAGTNVQDRLAVNHDLDAPWRPSDLEQRGGRIVRQGNMNEEVSIYRYVTNATFDAYLYQTLENKQRFISQIMSSKSPVRSCEDVDESVLSYAEIKALCAGNPLIKEKMDLDIEVARLRLLKSDHQSQRFRLEDDLLTHYPAQIKAATERIAGIEKDIALYNTNHEKSVDVQSALTGDGDTASAATVTAHFPGMTINGVEYTEKEPAAKALIDATKTYNSKSDAPFGKYMGFDMKLSFDSFEKKFSLLLRGSMTYQVELGTDTFGNITRINNALSDLPKRLEGAKNQLETLTSQQEAAKQELEKPFALADNLKEKEVRLALLNAELNIDDPNRAGSDGGLDVLNDADDRAEAEPKQGDEYGEYESEEYEPEYGSSVSARVASKSERPSLLDGIRSWDSAKQPSDSGKKSTEHDI